MIGKRILSNMAGWTWLVTAGLTLAIAAPAGAQSQAIDSSALPKQNASTPVADLAGERLDSSAIHPGDDPSALSSSVPPAPAGSSLRLGTVVSVTLNQPVSSGVQHNGQTVRGHLTAPVRTTAGTLLPRGMAIEATVVSSAAAGVIGSGGVLSLQLTHVGRIAVVTDVRDFNGQEGHKDVADSAPGKGQEAIVATGTPLHFKVLQMGHVPGVVPGVPPANTTGKDHGRAPDAQQGTQPDTPDQNQPGIPRRQVPGATEGVVPGAPK